MNIKFLASLFLVLAASFTACGNQDDAKEISCAIEYPSVKVGDNTWMSRNMNDSLYSWVAAQTVCPEGWHLPTEKEVFFLMEFAKLRAHRDFPAKTFRSRQAKERYWNRNTAKVLHSLGFGSPSANASFWAASSNSKNVSASFSVDAESASNYTAIEIRMDEQSSQDVKAVRCVKNKFSL